MTSVSGNGHPKGSLVMIFNGQLSLKARVREYDCADINDSCTVQKSLVIKDLTNFQSILFHVLFPQAISLKVVCSLFGDSIHACIDACSSGLG
jgi:hypothetical protein